MKIGMLVDTYLPIMGGAEIHVLELSRALHALGYEIEVCTAVPGSENLGTDEVSDAPAEGQPEYYPPVLRLPGLVGGGWRALSALPGALPSLVRFVRQVDVVHCHYSFLLAAMGTLLARLLGKPSAVTLHGQGTLDSSVSGSALWRLYRYLSLKLADTIIATSEEMRAVALRFAPSSKIVLIPNGVNARKFSPHPKPQSLAKEVIILTMRRLAPKNGVQYLVEAAPAVLREVPQARFWVAGEGKLESYIRQRVADLGLQEAFRFIGIVPHTQTPEYYRQADIVVFPSSAESISLACLEAMAMEKAIVASSLATYHELLGDAGERGLLVTLFDRQDSDYNAPLQLPAERIQSLAQAIIRLAQDAALRIQLGRAARHLAEEGYDWRPIAAQTALLYQEKPA